MGKLACMHLLVDLINLNFWSSYCSVRTSISMQFFPRFFLLYFLVFHIYFFSYTYGMRISVGIKYFISFFFILWKNWWQWYSLFMTSTLILLPGFSYLAFSATAAFMQHLILYFWNRFEVSLLLFLLMHFSLVFRSKPCYHPLSTLFSSKWSDLDV